MFGHDDFRNVLYTWDQADQRLMIARLERRQAHPAIAGNHSRDAVADEGINRSLQIGWPSQRVWMSR